MVTPAAVISDQPVALTPPQQIQTTWKSRIVSYLKQIPSSVVVKFKETSKTKMFLAAAGTVALAAAAMYGLESVRTLLSNEKMDQAFQMFTNGTQTIPQNLECPAPLSKEEVARLWTLPSKDPVCALDQIFSREAVQKLFASFQEECPVSLSNKTINPGFSAAHAISMKSHNDDKLKIAVGSLAFSLFLLWLNQLMEISGLESKHSDEISGLESKHSDEISKLRAQLRDSERNRVELQSRIDRVWNGMGAEISRLQRELAS